MPLLLIGLWFGFRSMTYQVGDYYDDGEKQGVVFEVDESGCHGKIVSLDEADLQWCTSEESNIGAIDSYNGRNNQDLIEQIADWRTKYPAFAWCADQGKGWYLPTVEELRVICLVKDKVDRTLVKMSRDQIKGVLYWSSTEAIDKYAWIVYMYDGYTSNDLKNLSYYVRAVSAF
jgi:hypothetical protein